MLFLLLACHPANPCFTRFGNTRRVLFSLVIRLFSLQKMDDGTGRPYSHVHNAKYICKHHWPRSILGLLHNPRARYPVLLSLSDNERKLQEEGTTNINHVWTVYCFLQAEVSFSYQWWNPDFYWHFMFYNYKYKWLIYKVNADLLCLFCFCRFKDHCFTEEQSSILAPSIVYHRGPAMSGVHGKAGLPVLGHVEGELQCARASVL